MNASSGDRQARAVLDTNLFVSGLIRAGSVPYQLLRAWLRGLFALVTSSELRAEVTEVLGRPKFARYEPDAQLVADILGGLAAAEQATPVAQLPVAVRDPKDVKILACALGGRVDYLVSGDDDLRSLDGNPALRGLRIVTAREFLTILGDPIREP